METNITLIADSLEQLPELEEPVPVTLTHELVRLLSDQLYQSPVKAIEELVVNSYDADAKECRVYVPDPATVDTSDTSTDYIAIYDDGIGMTREGLVNLWHIGNSNKRTLEIESKRKQIGKFGIGKLATYTIGKRLTHITKSDRKVLSVTVNYNDFSSSSSSPVKEILLPVREVTDIRQFLNTSYLHKVLESLGISPEKLEKLSSWTIVVLEGLKEKAEKLRSGKLRWVLRTAMPLKADFQLYLNGEKIDSSKEDYEPIVSFDLSDLSKERIEKLTENTKQTWHIEGCSLLCDTFPSGVSGKIIITRRTLTEGKSSDIGRSHGFFVRVLGRLINEDEPLFGIETPLYHGVFNRFRADLIADDLDDELKASREGLEDANRIRDFKVLLRSIFNEAHTRYNEYLNNNPKKNREGDREVVPKDLVERPIADALMSYQRQPEPSGAEADNSWFYTNVDKTADISEVIQKLYAETRNKYRYEYIEAGKNSRLVSFDPVKATFWLNQNHELVQEYQDFPEARSLLEDIATAETMLEAYLRESHIPPSTIGEILENRDALLRSLAKDRSYSLSAISEHLREAATDEHELEIMLVVAMRALGFVAKHESGSGKPDGIARFTDYPGGQKTITLEAKSSVKKPSLGAIDFAGLQEHVLACKAHGCLLVAPEYPGERDDNSAVSNRAKTDKISCWTVEQLARFVLVAEKRQYNAKHVIDIVLNKFSPNEVACAIEDLLSEPSWNNTDLYGAVLDALKSLENQVLDFPRSIPLVVSRIVQQQGLEKVEGKSVRQAVMELAHASQGGMILNSDDNIITFVSLEELERRLSGLLKTNGESRRISFLSETRQLAA